jgi:hypothetical protein
MRPVLENFCQSFSCENLWLLHTGIVLGGTAALHALRAWGAVIFCTSFPKGRPSYRARGSKPTTFVVQMLRKRKVRPATQTGIERPEREINARPHITF